MKYKSVNDKAYEIKQDNRYKNLVLFYENRVEVFNEGISTLFHLLKAINEDYGSVYKYLNERRKKLANL